MKNEKPKGIDSAHAIMADMHARGEITTEQRIAMGLHYISRMYGMDPPTSEEIEEAIARDIEAQKKVVT